MPSHVVQANLGQYAVAAATSYASLTVTGTALFASPTTAGNTLILKWWASDRFHTMSNFGNTTPTLGTATFANAGWNNWLTGSLPFTAGYTGIFFLNNAPSVGTSTPLTFLLADGSSTSLAVETSVYEVSGLGLGNLEGRNTATGTASAPTALVQNFTVSCFAFLGVAASMAGTLGAAAGYTLGPSAATITVGEAMYQSGVISTINSGFYTVSFVGTANQWATNILLFPEATMTAAAAYRYSFPTLIL